jgi:hypothetical protein
LEASSLIEQNPISGDPLRRPGLHYGDFRPLVEKNGVVGWKLLQRMVKMLRVTREEAHELENALGTLRRFDEGYPG